MKLIVHDFGGYAFPLQLSQALVQRGINVVHLYCASHTTTPPGVPRAPAHTEGRLTVEGIRLSEPLNKYNLAQRWRQESAYGRLAARAIRRHAPDVVLSANTPLDAQTRIAKACKTLGARSLYWLQDLIGVATDRILRRKLPGFGALIGAHYLRMERRLLADSDVVIAITQNFLSVLDGYGVPAERRAVIPNWGPVDEIPVRPKDNAWAQAHGLDRTFCFLYTGTLSLKHNPDLLLQLARSLGNDARVVVVSQGQGVDRLSGKKSELGLDNLILLPYQPVDAIPDMLASADVLTALLEPEASAFSVPSKVLTYLCAGRPILLGVPGDNEAARIVTDHGAGLVAPPTHPEAFVEAAKRLIRSEDDRMNMGAHARAYAEAAFSIERIADRFEALL